ncbi:MAG TPA: sigma-70 family RNA polymerase sigma factor [Kofleriaceae bacterium]|nr:sigma-70 family RNA polymerase sigma factor [Kofleriaceae bacterium]
MLRPGVLRMTPTATTWTAVAAQLRPFLARRVDAADVDDVLHDVWLRVERGLPALRDEERFTAWLFQIARNAVADHQRTRARHPTTELDEPPEPVPVPGDDDREAARALACCVAVFVARLPSPYREAVSLIELEGLMVREAADMLGVSLAAMKSRVQRGRAQLRQLLEACCEIALDARGKVIDFTPRTRTCPACP